MHDGDAGDATAREIDRIRAFSREATRRLGVLDEQWQGRGRPLNQSRLLYELGDGPLPLTMLRDRLGLDSGYASRLLRALEDDGLLEVREDVQDARARRVSLTDAGVEEVAVLDRLSDRHAASMVAGLGPARRARLVSAMDEVRTLLLAAGIEIVDVDPFDDRVLVAQQRYVTELAARFPAGFEPGDLTIDLPSYARPHGACLLALLDGEVIGTAALAALDGSPGSAATMREIKRMWVSPDRRGLGLGRRLLDAVEDRARMLGTAVLRLDTNRTLGSAIALYETAGYRPIPRYNDNRYATHFFEKRLAA